MFHLLGLECYLLTSCGPPSEGSILLVSDSLGYSSNSGGPSTRRWTYTLPVHNLPKSLPQVFAMLTVLVVSCLIGKHGAIAQSTTVLQTAIPSPTVPSGNFLPSQAQLPPQQDWCPSRVYCAGEVRTSSDPLISVLMCGQLLQAVSIANLYSADKIFVDKVCG
jgi:hypothetical protein